MHLVQTLPQPIFGLFAQHILIRKGSPPPIEPFTQERVQYFERIFPSMKPKVPFFFISLLWAATCWAQTSPGAVPQASSVVQDPVQGGWYAPATTDDDRFMQDQAEVHPMNMQAEFQQIRLDRNQALVRNKGTLTGKDRELLAEKARRIEELSPNSFEAHMAHFYAEFPKVTAFQHLDRAAMRDAGRTELIGPKLADAARRQNQQELEQWSRAMLDRGQVAPGLWEFADDLFASVERNGVLVAAGEMDAYPLWTRQFASGERTDVLVIDIRLLGDPAYRQRIWDKTKAKGKVPGSETHFLPELAGAINRPLHFSPALGRDRIPVPIDDLYVVGLSLQYSSGPIDNIPLLEARWAQMKKTTTAGPLSRNYLLPSVVLLEHYREQQDETKASRTEHELRALANKLNATEELYRMGVFEH